MDTETLDLDTSCLICGWTYPVKLAPELSEARCRKCGERFFIHFEAGRWALEQMRPEHIALAEIHEMERQRQLLAEVRPGMVLVPPGYYLYGIKKTAVPGFWIDRTLITNRMYQVFLDAHPGYAPPLYHFSHTATEDIALAQWRKVSRFSQQWIYPEGREDYPVVLVSWDDATAYAKWAGKRLPKYHEWQRAALGSERESYPWGREAPREFWCNMHRSGPTPVSLFSPQGDSIFGCTDMAGNVEEWIDEDFRDAKMLLGGYLSGAEWADEHGPRRVDIPESCDKSHKWISIGFRCAADWTPAG